MEILVMMLLISLSLAIGFLGAFFWANRKKQFDDLVTPSWRAILEDTPVQKKERGCDAEKL